MIEDAYRCYCRILASQPPPSDEATFIAARLDEEGLYRVGVGVRGRPAILMSSSICGQDVISVELEHLRVKNNVRCSILESGAQFSAEYLVVQLRTEETELIKHFLKVMSAILTELGANPSPKAVSNAILQVSELFRALRRPSKKSLRGLWAECYVIARSPDPAKLLEAWHSTPTDTYDFVRGIERVEVKSCSSRKREHHFSLNQLTPPRGTIAIIVSLFVLSAGKGISLMDLVDTIEGAVPRGKGLVVKLHAQIAESLGEQLTYSMNERYDEEAAKDSLRCFPSTSIPSVQGGIPKEVSEIHFKVDLSALEGSRNFRGQHLMISG